MLAAKFIVSGKVQGVFYRASTREQALQLGLSGIARNLADGRVEVLAGGSREALAAFERWLWNGPAAAQVEAVSREDMAAQAWRGFVIG
ncbi:MAG: acylphosphatase [Rhodanobacter sp.]|nr:MAG: acylphosphatase [Rhodanobacter sp.]